MTGMLFLAEITWKGALILAAACSGGLLLRGASASVRHFVWTAAFVALLILPAATLLLPRWQPAATIVQPVQTIHIRASRPATPAPAKPVHLPTGEIWAAGAMAVALFFLTGAARTSWLVRRASAAPYAEATILEFAASLGIRRRVRALQCSSAPAPLTWGTLRPVVVLPEDAARWPLARLRTVLLHELIHVERLDVLAQTLAHGACALYWFNPLAWVALRQLRKERERACDDAVLLRGVSAPDYADHLLSLVRGMVARRNTWAQAPSMAEASDLESRVRALLDRSRNRRPVSRWAAAAILAAVAIVTLPIAAITAHAQAPGIVSGIVEDPSGSRVPQCRVTARHEDGVHRETAVANAAGEYSFATIPVGRYTLEFSARGFALQKVPLDLSTGVAQRVDAHLSVGEITESLTVTGQRPSSVPAPTANALPQRIPIGGSVQMARLVRQPRPVYPENLKLAGIEAHVMIKAIISKEGEVLNPRVVNTVDPALAQAALDSVRQWRYTPTLLNGQPVEVLTTIDIGFDLNQ